jgi:hypothetical protein
MELREQERQQREQRRLLQQMLEREMLKHSLAKRPTPPAGKSAPQKRHAPKSGPAIAVLKDLYPPDGCPSREAFPDSELKRVYHVECDRRGIHKNDRVSDTQLLRCAGRKKT